MKDVEIGIISDTHGLVRPELVRELAGVAAIIHAGDIGKPEVLDELNRIAPVTAVRGNVDSGAWADTLRRTEVVEIPGGPSFYVLHNISLLDLDPKASGFDAVIYGHSHKPSIEEREGILYVNPGSAGPRRFSLPVTLIRAALSKGKIFPRLISLRV